MFDELCLSSRPEDQVKKVFKPVDFGIHSQVFAKNGIQPSDFYAKVRNIPKVIDASNYDGTKIADNFDLSAPMLG